MPKIIILSEENCDTIVDLLQHEADFCKQEIDQEDSTRVWERLIELFDKAPSEHTIRIIVHGGMVQDVLRLPAGFNYEVQDFDNCSECGEVEPYCEWCEKEFQRHG